MRTAILVVVAFLAGINAPRASGGISCTVDDKTMAFSAEAEAGISRGLGEGFSASSHNSICGCRIFRTICASSIARRGHVSCSGE